MAVVEMDMFFSSPLSSPTIEETSDKPDKVDSHLISSCLHHCYIKCPPVPICVLEIHFLEVVYTVNA